jgi:hypothetical protein
MQLGMRDGRPVQLGLEHRSLHDGALTNKKWMTIIPKGHK